MTELLERPKAPGGEGPSAPVVAVDPAPYAPTGLESCADSDANAAAAAPSTRNRWLIVGLGVLAVLVLAVIAVVVLGSAAGAAGDCGGG